MFRVEEVGVCLQVVLKKNVEETVLRCEKRRPYDHSTLEHGATGGREKAFSCRFFFFIVV